MENEKVEEIQHLINQMFEEEKKSENVFTSENAFTRNMDLRKQLEAIGPEIVAPILTDLFAKKKENKLSSYQRCAFGSPVFHLIDAIEKLARPEHAKQLAEMLLWDEIALATDGSNRYNLFRILKRVGNKSAIPILRKVARKVKRVKFRNPDPNDIDPDKSLSAAELHRNNQEDVKETIKACKERSKTSLQNN